MFRLACGLYDQLEVFAMRKTLVEITFMDDDGVEFTEKGIISDLIVKDGVEKIIFNNTKEIKAQDILIVNGVDFKE
ncbi:MAG: hypothetical protein ABFR62_06475 [Bacteroidota bacterium]